MKKELTNPIRSNPDYGESGINKRIEELYEVQNKTASKIMAVAIKIKKEKYK